MFGKLFSFCFLLFLFTACAKPNYQTTNVQNKMLEQSFQTVGLNFQIEWEHTPSPMQYESFLLKFYSAADPSLFVDPGFQPFVVLWMPSMGHGAQPVSVTKISDGIYQITKIYFTMSGEWDLRIQLKEGAIVHEQVIVPITL